MREKRETPEPWKGAFERAGFESLNALHDKTGVSVQALTRLVHAEGESSDATIKKVGEVLKPADAKKVWTWARPEVPDHGEYVPPPQARALGPIERRALDTIIKSMAARNGEVSEARRAGMAEGTMSDAVEAVAWEVPVVVPKRKKPDADTGRGA